MLEAMMKAEVGDDVFREDPTINLLEEKLASMFSQEAGLFCPSGTMANQIALQVHTRPGDEVICSELAHIYLYEGGGMAKNSGLSARLLKGDKGRITASDVEANINPTDSHYPRTKLVALEDTSNKGGGSCYAFDEVMKIKGLCLKKSLGFHLDGARIFNALTVRNQSPSEYGRLFDSISICLSKGLGSPVGSVLLGNRDFIKEAHRSRKVFGGGMRQAGILAAAGIYALEHNVALLSEDHKKAKRLKAALELNDLVLEIIDPETNIVIFQLKPGTHSADFCKLLKDRGILALPFGPDKVRMVTHLDIKEEDILHCEKMIPGIR
jgi:threonine aldolase